MSGRARREFKREKDRKSGSRKKPERGGKYKTQSGEKGEKPNTVRRDLGKGQREKKKQKHKNTPPAPGLVANDALVHLEVKQSREALGDPVQLRPGGDIHRGGSLAALVAGTRGGNSPGHVREGEARDVLAHVPELGDGDVDREVLVEDHCPAPVLALHADGPDIVDLVRGEVAQVDVGEGHLYVGVAKGGFRVRVRGEEG